MRGALLLAALLAWGGFAQAEGLDGGADVPCAEVVDAGALEPFVFPPDGGPALAITLRRCQLAPETGTFLTTGRAAALAGERAGLRFQAAAAKRELEKSDAQVAALQGLVAAALTAAAYAYCRGHDCNPLHVGR